MDYWIRAEELKKRYVVYGSFYNLMISGTEALPCRNRLEIFERSASWPSPQLQPDALFIMMNPGSSAPLGKDIPLPAYSVGRIAKAKEVPLGWVPAKPDITQYQVMRVMLVKKWNYVRVINLSDIREPKSPAFISIVKQMAVKEPLGLHSIFSKERSREQAGVFDLKTGAPVVLAWGCDSFLCDLARRGFASGYLQNTIGIGCDEEGLLYAHASPTLQTHKERWLENILKAV